MNRFCRVALAGLLTAGLGACSTIQSWFPDKQKEYRYSSEIPPLEIPPDLIGSTPEIPSDSHAATVADAAADVRSPASAVADSPIGKYRPSQPGVEESATLAQDNTGTHIAIEAPFANVWTMAEKAINRLHIEIKDKDRSQKMLYVYYSEDAKPFKPSWSDDIFSAFRDSHRDDEREYQVRLEEVGDVLTKIRVLDSAGKAQSEGEGRKLLQIIYRKILLLNKPEPELRNAKPEHEQSDEGIPAKARGKK